MILVAAGLAMTLAMTLAEAETVDLESFVYTIRSLGTFKTLGG